MRIANAHALQMLTALKIYSGHTSCNYSLAIPIISFCWERRLYSSRTATDQEVLPHKCSVAIKNIARTADRVASMQRCHFQL